MPEIGDILHGLRIVLMDADSQRAQVLAQALRGRGALVAETDVSENALERARSVDPEVIVLDGAAVDGGGFEAVRVLRKDPQLRWSALLVARWDEIWPEGRGAPNLDGLLERIAPLLQNDMALAERALADSRIETKLELTGPSRLLRMLLRAGGTWHITVKGGCTVEVDLSDGLVVGARSRGASGAEGIGAIAALLKLSSAEVRVERKDHPSVANIMSPVDEVLGAAAAEAFDREVMESSRVLDSPTVRPPEAVLEEARLASKEAEEAPRRRAPHTLPDDDESPGTRARPAVLPAPVVAPKKPPPKPGAQPPRRLRKPRAATLVGVGPEVQKELAEKAAAKAAAKARGASPGAASPGAAGRPNLPSPKKPGAGRTTGPKPAPAKAAAAKPAPAKPSAAQEPVPVAKPAMAVKGTGGEAMKKTLLGQSPMAQPPPGKTPPAALKTTTPFGTAALGVAAKKPEDVAETVAKQPDVKVAEAGPQRPAGPGAQGSGAWLDSALIELIESERPAESEGNAPIEVEAPQPAKVPEFEPMEPAAAAVPADETPSAGIPGPAEPAAAGTAETMPAPSPEQQAKLEGERAAQAEEAAAELSEEAAQAVPELPAVSEAPFKRSRVPLFIGAGLLVCAGVGVAALLFVSDFLSGTPSTEVATKTPPEKAAGEGAGAAEGEGEGASAGKAAAGAGADESAGAAAAMGEGEAEGASAGAGAGADEGESQEADEGAGADEGEAESAAEGPQGAGGDKPEKPDPEESDRLVVLARRLIRDDKFDEARQTLERAMAFDERNPRAYAGFGEYYLARGQGKEALEWIKKAVRVRPRRAAYRVLEGDALMLLGNEHAARRAWRRALETDPNDREAKKRLDR